MAGLAAPSFGAAADHWLGVVVLALRGRLQGLLVGELNFKEE